jgi:hypothetical protein
LISFFIRLTRRRPSLLFCHWAVFNINRDIPYRKLRSFYKCVVILVAQSKKKEEEKEKEEKKKGKRERERRKEE